MPAPASGQDYWKLYIFPERGGFKQGMVEGWFILLLIRKQKLAIKIGAVGFYLS